MRYALLLELALLLCTFLRELPFLLHLQLDLSLAFLLALLALLLRLPLLSLSLLRPFLRRLLRFRRWLLDLGRRLLLLLQLLLPLLLQFVLLALLRRLRLPLTLLFQLLLPLALFLFLLLLFPFFLFFLGLFRVLRVGRLSGGFGGTWLSDGDIARMAKRDPERGQNESRGISIHRRGTREGAVAPLMNIPPESRLNAAVGFL